MAQTLDLGTGALQFRHCVTPSRPRTLDFTRVGAEAGAIAINAAALLLLLAPLSPPVMPVEDSREIELVIPVAPPKPPEPIREVRVEPPRPRTLPVVAPALVPPPLEIERPVVDPRPGDTVVEPQPLADALSEPSGALAEPLAGAHLEYAAAPPPSYPVQALRDGLTGTVILRVRVDVDGTPLEVTVERSSGHRVLDAAARKQVLAKWRFRPAMVDGQAVQAIGRVPVGFELDR